MQTLGQCWFCFFVVVVLFFIVLTILIYNALQTLLSQAIISVKTFWLANDE